MKVQRCKGTRDLSPREMTVFRRIEGIFRDCCLKYGYQEVRTPTIEYLHLFTSVGTLTPDMLNKVYSFLDWDGWSGERVVLRPDGTIPVARLYIDCLADGGPARLFYTANMFVFDETGTKNRERWQCGAELIGAGNTVADAELIQLSAKVLETLGIKDIELRISHAGLIKALLGEFGLSVEEQTRLFDRIMDGDADALSGIKTGNATHKDTLLLLLNLKGQSPGFLKNLKPVVSAELPGIEPHLEDFIRIVDFLDRLDFDYRIDIASGAGFEYYTGLVFQYFAGGEKIGGGGRYDALIPAMGGGDIPASGFALYVDRLMSLIEAAKIEGKAMEGVMVRGDFSSPGSLEEAVKLADRLRSAGYTAQLEMGEGNMTNMRWVLETSTSAWLIIRDRQAEKTFEANTWNEALKILESNRVGKDSPA